MEALETKTDERVKGVMSAECRTLLAVILSHEIAWSSLGMGRQSLVMEAGYLLGHEQEGTSRKVRQASTRLGDLCSVVAGDGVAACVVRW